MDRLRSWPVYLGMWATQVSAITAVESLYREGPQFTTVVSVSAVLSAIGLYFGWRRACGRFQSPKAVSLLVGIPAGLWVLLMLLGARLPWVLLYLLVATQFARNPWVLERRDFYVSCGLTVVWVIFAAGHILAGWSLAKFFVLYVAALLFALIAHHVDERFFTAEGGRQDALLGRGVVPLTALAMSVVVVGIGALVYLFAVRPASLQLGVVDAAGGVTPRLRGEGIDLAPSSGDPAQMQEGVAQVLRVLFGEGIAQTLAGGVGALYFAVMRTGELFREAMSWRSFSWLAILAAAACAWYGLRRSGVVGYVSTWIAYVRLRRRARSSDPGSIIVEAYRSVEQALRRKAYPRDAHRTHREYLHALQTHPWLAPLAPERAFETFARVRYGSHQPSRSDAEEVIALLGRVLESWWRIPRPGAEGRAVETG